MSNSRSIREAVQRLAGTFGTNPLTVIIAQVVSVDSDAMTCVVDPLNDNSTVTMENVNLSAQPNDGLICYPSNDSIVLVAYAPKLDPFILQFSDIDKCRITIEGCEYYIDKDGIKLHGDNLGGLVKVNSLVTAYNQVVADLTALIAAFSALGVIIPPQATIKTAIDLENNKVQHGNI